jgi:nicotinate phosphoribosyltransferase
VRPYGPVSAVFTDLYELTMMAGYFHAGRHLEPATFDLFHRRPPDGVELVVCAGLDPALEYLESLRFAADELDYLAGLGMFADDFLHFLAGLRFSGSVHAIPEGTPVFPDEPMLRLSAPLAEAQLVETALLNRISYSTLVASTAAQVVHAAQGKAVLEFGARRAHGPDGALSGTRAAMIGGCAATSNTEAGARFGVEVSGTQAHSWIMSFPSELDAFRCYAAAFPDDTVLLVDTYDTIATGLPNAIIVARELAAQGRALRGIRLDSGDLDGLSRDARAMLDDAGLPEVRILASGDLDADRVAALEARAAPIDGYGVGTSLLTARRDPALSAVYKLAEIGGEPVLKISGDVAKTTSPGRKQVWRSAEGDVIGLADEQGEGQPLLVEVLRDGRRTSVRESVAELRERCLAESATIRPSVQRGEWTVRRSERLEALRSQLVEELRDGKR